MGRALAALRRRPPKAKRAREAAFRRLVSQGFSTDVAATASRTWSEEQERSPDVRFDEPFVTQTHESLSKAAALRYTVSRGFRAYVPSRAFKIENFIFLVSSRSYAHARPRAFFMT